MPYTQCLYHIVIRTRHSLPAITPEHERDVYHNIYSYCQHKGCKLLRVGGMPDHIHIFIDLHPTLSPSAFVHDLKIHVSHYLKERRDLFPRFEGWSKSYCAISKSYDEKETVIRYIKGQKEHHKRVPLGEELRTLLAATHIEIDERYFLNDAG